MGPNALGVASTRGTNRAYRDAVHEGLSANLYADAARGDALATLVRALVDAGPELPRILDALTTSLTASLCDRCSIDLATRTSTEPVAARLVLVTSRHAILPLSGTGLHGALSVMRDDDSQPFEGDELADIQTCVTCATLVADLVMQLEAERAAARAQHERADEFHRTLVRVVGHDMRAPASAILIGTEMLVAKHQDDPSLAGVVNRIVSFANRMTGMVDQLVDLSRAQLGGGIPLSRVEVRLTPLIQSVLDELARRYPQHQFSLSGDAELKGTWDPDRLRQVTSSLVMNAVRHGLPGGPIRIVMSQDERNTTFSVHNEVGEAPIAPEALPELFEARRRFDEEYSGGGLGVGLYIVREIVEAHRGRVEVEATATRTTFHVVLPNGS
jgi:signal transduction histidine kinase